MNSDQPIITLTMSPCLDISVEIDRLVPDAKMRCRNLRQEPGGGGINASRAIAILGGSTRAVFPAGGSNGALIEELLGSQGVRSNPIRIGRQTRESFAIQVIEEGRQYRFTLPGPELDDQVYDACLRVITGFDPPPAFVVASGGLPTGAPQDFYAELTGILQAKGIKVIIDTWGAPLKHTFKQTPYLIKPNRRELEWICDCSLKDATVQQDVCRELVDSGACEILVLTLGKDGALLTTRQDQFRLGGIKVHEQSSIGAGDSFMGAMALALQQDRTVHQAFLFGMAAGTAALLTPGSELCRREDTERFFADLLRQRTDAGW